MQYKSQQVAMQARSLDGQGKSHSHAPESGRFGPGATRSTTTASATHAGTFAAATRELQGFLTRTRRNVRAANAYVREQPWRVVVAVAAAGLVLGFLLARRPTS